MKDVISKLLIQAISCTFILLLIEVWASCELSYRTFRDTIELSNVEEAMKYQKEIINTALEYNADIITSDISITSPPKYTYKIILPITETTPHIFNNKYTLAIPQIYYFPFGDTELHSTIPFWIIITLFSTICLGSFGFISWLIWRE